MQAAATKGPLSPTEEAFVAAAFVARWHSLAAALALAAGVCCFAHACSVGLCVDFLYGWCVDVEELLGIVCAYACVCVQLMHGVCVP